MAGINAERDMWKHLTEVMDRLNKVEQEAKKQHRQDTARIKELETKVKELEQRNTVLQNEIDRLKHKDDTNSHNSSLPPSTDQKPGKKANEYNGRKKTGKPSGGQKGHAGRTLRLKSCMEKLAAAGIEPEIEEIGDVTKPYTITRWGRVQRGSSFYCIKSARQTDKVLTKSISRFARNTTDCLEMVRELSALGISILFERENLDTGTMSSDFILTLLSCFSAFESTSISGNIKLGIHHRFQSGTYNQPCVPFGYARTPDGVVIVPAEAEVVREIFSLALTGLGTANIARILNDRHIPTAEGKKWVASTVQTILHNPFYAGDVLLQKHYNDDQYKSRKNKGERDQFYLPDHHAPIISHEAFENAEALISQRAKESSASNREAEGHYPFQSKLFCAECGSPLHRVKTKTSITHVCDAFARNVGGCERGTRVLEDDVKNAFLTVLNKLAFSQRLGTGNRIIDLYIQSIRERERERNRERLEAIDGELAGIRGQMETIGASIRFKPGDRAKLNGLRTRTEALKREKMALETRPSDTAKAERLRAFVHGFDGGGFPDTAFTELVERATVKTGEYIEFTFTCGITLRQSIAAAVLAAQETIPTAVAS